MSILIDSRVGSKGYVEPISKRVTCPVRLAVLDSGDVAFEGNGPDGSILVAVEIKQIADFINSMRSGRLVDQVSTMQGVYELVVVQIVGLFRPNEDGIIEGFTRGDWAPLMLGDVCTSVFHYKEVDNHVTMLEMKKNVIVKRASTKLEAVWQIANLYTLLQREWDSHKSTEQIKIQSGDSLFRKASVTRMVAAQLPSVGWTRSKAIADKFGTVENLANALPTELAQVEGIGKKTALAIYGAMRTRE